MRRREFIALLSGAIIYPHIIGRQASAQRRSKMPRVGVLWPGAPPDKWDEAFRQGLRAHGYVDGQNISLEYRWAEGRQERLSELAEELVRLKLDLIATISAPQSLHSNKRPLGSLSSLRVRAIRCARDSSRAWPGRAAISPV